jgi:hypothetical protein
MPLIQIRVDTDRRLRRIVRATPNAAIVAVVDRALRELESRLASGAVDRADLTKVLRPTYHDSLTPWERFKRRRDALKQQQKCA